jgi:hypothetical protein
MGHVYEAIARLRTYCPLGLVEDVFGVVIARVGAASEGREVVSVGVDADVHVAVLICCFDEDSLRERKNQI